MAVRVLNHPLAQHLLTELRDRDTPPAEFRHLADVLAGLLIIEATRGLEVEPRAVETPLGVHTGERLAQGLAIVPVLRAGLSMLEAGLRLYPDVAVGYIGLERSHETAVAASYYCKLPILSDRTVLLVDPMLATGGSASQATALLKSNGASEIVMVSVIAAPEGVARMQADHPGVDIITAAIDVRLDANCYIFPGLGDYGDRLYGTE